VVALAGYMRIVGPELVGAFADRILNVHPALLPAFPGTSAVADALAWGVKVTGVTVHLVDEEVDHGPIVLQEAIEVRPEDDPDALEGRIHEVEHRLLPAAVRALGEGRLVVEGRTVRVVRAAPRGPTSALAGGGSSHVSRGEGWSTSRARSRRSASNSSPPAGRPRRSRRPASTGPRGERGRGSPGGSTGGGRR